MYRLTLQLAGRRKTVLAPIGGQEQRSTTTWPTRTTSRKPICSCTTSIGRRGRLKSCYDRGSRSGDPHPSFSLGSIRAGVAGDAGLAEHQRKTALPVACVPDPDFEEAIEADEPPTITALAQHGRRAPNEWDGPDGQGWCATPRSASPECPWRSPQHGREREARGIGSVPHQRLCRSRRGRWSCPRPNRGFNWPYEIPYRGLKLPRISAALGYCYLRSGADLPQVDRLPHRLTPGPTGPSPHSSVPAVCFCCHRCGWERP